MLQLCPSIRHYPTVDDAAVACENYQPSCVVWHAIRAPWRRGCILTSTVRYVSEVRREVDRRRGAPLDVALLFEIFLRFIFLVHDAADWSCCFYFNRRQRTSVKGRRLVGRHNDKMFAFPPREHDVLYQPVKAMRRQLESDRVWDVPIAVAFYSMPDRGQFGAGRDLDLIYEMARCNVRLWEQWAL